jgi:hypothetical protein
MNRVIKNHIYFALIALSAALVATSVRAADAPKDDSNNSNAPQAELKIINPEHAKEYEGQDVVVEFDVVSSKELGTGLCFLNSIADYTDPNGFTVVISAKALGKFKQDPKTEKPADYFKTKRIRVSGKVLQYQKDKDSPKKYEIKVDDPSQITVVEQKTNENADKKMSP